MPMACYPNRCWDLCVSEEEKKEIDPMFIQGLWKCVLAVYNWEVLAHFRTENCMWIYFSDFGTFLPKYILINVQNNLALVIIQNIFRPKCLWIIYIGKY